MMAGGLLIIIDVQKGFVTPDTAHVPAAAAMLARDFDRVLATRFVNPPGSMHRRLIHWARFAPGSGETELAFDPPPDARIVDKTGYTALSPALLEEYGAAKVDEVHLCGIATDGCVLKTAVDLFEAGIRPRVHVAACGSHGGPECHRAGLLLLRRFVGEDQIVDRGLAAQSSTSARSR